VVLAGTVNFGAYQIFHHAFCTDQSFRGIGRSRAKIADRTPVKAANVFIVMVENTSADWSFGDGKAQMVDGTFEKMMRTD
jgi:hypothetical protein